MDTYSMHFYAMLYYANHLNTNKCVDIHTATLRKFSVKPTPFRKDSPLIEVTAEPG